MPPPHHDGAPPTDPHRVRAAREQALPFALPDISIRAAAPQANDVAEAQMNANAEGARSATLAPSSCGSLTVSRSGRAARPRSQPGQVGQLAAAVCAAPALAGPT
jgi:hypothetical protein